MQYFEIMLDIIKRLNRGETIVPSEYGAAKPGSRTIKNYLNGIKKYFLKESLRNEHGTWKVRSGFLRVLGMSAEELVVLVDLLNKAENNPLNLKEIKEKIVTEYSNKGLSKSTDDKEKISTSMRITIQTINSAIESKKKISFVFSEHARIVQPCHIFSREYYWYLAGYEEQKKCQKTGNEEHINKMKTFSVNKIKSITELEENIDYDFSNAFDILKYALNGYITWEDKPQEVHLLIHKNLANNIDRAGAYNHWIRIHWSEIKKDYLLYKTKSVHSEYKDIIPTIMRYAPEIIIIEPLELMKAAHAQAQEISNLFISQLPKH